MKYIKSYEKIDQTPIEFSHIKQYREKRPPMIGDYVRMTDEFYDDAIKNVDYVSGYNMKTKLYRIAVGQISGYNKNTKEYEIYFEEYEFWHLKYTATIDDIRSYAKSRKNLENLPVVGDYVILGFDKYQYICKVISRKRSDLRWSTMDFIVKKLEIGLHDGKGIITTTDQSISHFSKNLEELEGIVSANKYNI